LCRRFNSVSGHHFLFQKFIHYLKIEIRISYCLEVTNCDHQRWLLDSDLPRIYGVKTKVLNQAVKRNPDRFPPDFMFQLNEKETEFLRNQVGTSKTGLGGRRNLPYVFTEHGALILSSVLNSHVAVEASIQVVRSFIQLRELLISHANLARKLAELEKKYDSQFKDVFSAIEQLMTVHITVWAIEWEKNGTAIHDRVNSPVGIHVVRGAVKEEHFHPPNATPVVQNLQEGQAVGLGGIPYVHRVSGEAGISLHIYSPPLKEMTFYDVDERGSLIPKGTWADDTH
jgi:ORF6N domain/Cysteine dioxygenase type I